MGLDRSRCVLILGKKPDETLSRGTGYRIGGRFVLTARHVLEGRTDRMVWCETCAGGKECKITDDWPLPATDLGLALIGGCSEPVGDIPLGKSANVKDAPRWPSRGYPNRGQERQTSSFPFSVESQGDLSNDRIDLLSVGQLKEQDGWKGASGAPLFEQDACVAVLVAYDEADARELIAVRITDRVKQAIQEIRQKNADPFQDAVDALIRQVGRKTFHEWVDVGIEEKATPQRVFSRLRSLIAKVNAKMRPPNGNRMLAQPLAEIIRHALVKAVPEELRNELTEWLQKRNRKEAVDACRIGPIVHAAIILVAVHKGEAVVRLGNREQAFEPHNYMPLHAISAVDPNFRMQEAKHLLWNWLRRKVQINATKDLTPPSSPQLEDDLVRWLYDLAEGGNRPFVRVKEESLITAVLKDPALKDLLVTGEGGEESWLSQELLGSIQTFIETADTPEAPLFP